MEQLGRAVDDGATDDAEGLVTLNISFRDATLESVDALSAELRAAAPVERLNVFFSRQGALP